MFLWPKHLHEIIAILSGRWPYEDTAITPKKEFPDKSDYGGNKWRGRGGPVKVFILFFYHSISIAAFFQEGG